MGSKPIRLIRRVAVAGLLAVAVAVFTGTGTPTPAGAACAISVNLGLGSSGAPVRCLQETLNARGYASGPVDGSFGGMTFRAVLAFQRANGLAADGLVGRHTATALGIWGSAPVPPPGGGDATPSPSPAPPAGGCSVNSSLRLGSSGPSVVCLQSALGAAGFSPGPSDGKFGARTRAAVVGYQRARGLYVDGVAGRQTATALGIWGSAAGGSSGSGGSPSASCDPPVTVPSDARQVVVVTSNGSRADVDLLVRSGSSWTCARSDMNGRVGRNGVRPLTQRTSGDGTTPGGVFPLGSMTAPDGQTFQFFGNGTNPGVQGGWRQVRNGDCWGATPGNADYNRLVTRTAATCTGDDEFLVNYQGSYSRAAIIGANLGADRSGDQPGEQPYAAAIFLHRHSYDAAGNSKATAGCVSLNTSDLAAVVTALVPGQAYFVIR